MPCKPCVNGKWKWGETGNCVYDSKAACERANEGRLFVERWLIKLCSLLQRRHHEEGATEGGGKAGVRPAG